MKSGQNPAKSGQAASVTGDGGLNQRKRLIYRKRLQSGQNPAKSGQALN